MCKNLVVAEERFKEDSIMDRSPTKAQEECDTVVFKLTGDSESVSDREDRMKSGWRPKEKN